MIDTSGFMEAAAHVARQGCERHFRYRTTIFGKLVLQIYRVEGRYVTGWVDAEASDLVCSQGIDPLNGRFI